MYRPRAFTVDDVDVLKAFVRQHPFATVACVVEGAVAFAYAPCVIGDEARLRFHLAIQNPLASATDGTRVRFSFLGPQAYVSPDWYRTLVTVPTWNYVAVEGEGAVRRLNEEELRRLLVDLSAQEEEPLRPKPPWLIDKVPAERTAALLKAIVGFEVRLDTLQGKFKLSQDKKPDDITGVIAGLEARGDAASMAVAREMRRLKT